MYLIDQLKALFNVRFAWQSLEILSGGGGVQYLRRKNS